ncbi:predicted protein [Botrytis cinerea T4]|uniref:Uncharacterized protein n=1 Tax=Botryotinia fuckeliana (strain T4) TaxID=999810 RepID=G2Y3E0_BOTF4|nr:predicted protein [Botrytis cinerea T4]
MPPFFRLPGDSSGSLSAEPYDTFHINMSNESIGKAVVGIQGVILRRLKMRPEISCYKSWYRSLLLGWEDIELSGAFDSPNNRFLSAEVFYP